MKKQPRTDGNSAVVVRALSVSPAVDDDFTLQPIFKDSKWELYTADSVATALAVIRARDIGVVICERDLRPGTWIDLLEKLSLLRHAPPLIVASRLADERLWAEALNLGAFDVLAKPFEARELVRSVISAWSRWHDQDTVPAQAAKAMHAA